GRARGDPVAVQRPADRHVAAAEDQRMLAVVQGLRAEVEPVARAQRVDVAVSLECLRELANKVMQPSSQPEDCLISLV
ncbi:hypothetical protein, partial [Ralstonia pseudosolanacearum]|uniref:hypothetical protein n=1 Tax=Ralstonia pseudosolanacearum TaxID=1310165 RepID=UPI003CF2D8F4